MSSESVIVVAVEDLGTAGVVAAGAAHFAMEQRAARVILLHVLDDHTVTNGLVGFMGVCAPVVEMAEEGVAALALAEAAMQAEYAGVNQSPPSIAREVREGKPGSVIGEVATQAGAAAIVIGARRPHAFGRLTHPDVVRYLRQHTQLPIYIVALQEAPSQTVAPASE